MTPAAASFFMLAAGAAGGLAILGAAWVRRPLPRALGALHGLFNLAGLCLLFAANLIDGDATPPFRWWALGILLLALSGGLLLSRAIFAGRVPPAIASVHGAIALIGLYILAPIAGLR